MAPMPATDRVAFIAGATGGLGRAVASALADDGLRLGLGGTDGGRLATVAADLRLADDRWVPAVGDVGSATGAQRAAQAVTDRFGRIDVLVHAVGGFEAGTPLADVPADTIQAMLDQHLWSTIHLVQAIVPGMVERGWGRVVAVATAAAVTAPAGSGPYAAAKGAQEILLRSLAKEVVGHGVTVNLVGVKAIDEHRERERAPSPKNAGWTTPEEIAETIRYLCSDAAAPINGARIPLDGRT